MLNVTEIKSILHVLAMICEFLIMLNATMSPIVTIYAVLNCLGLPVGCGLSNMIKYKLC